MELLLADVGLGLFPTYILLNRVKSQYPPKPLLEVYNTQLLCNSLKLKKNILIDKNKFVLNLSFFKLFLLLIFLSVQIIC